jgi:hypothetical protein
MSIHPTHTDKEVGYICQSIKTLANNFENWKKDYSYNATSNEFEYKKRSTIEKNMVDSWFKTTN